MVECSLCHNQDRMGLYVPLVGKDSKSYLACAHCFKTWNDMSVRRDKIDMFKDILNNNQQ